jgi:hypothetical protein
MLERNIHSTFPRTLTIFSMETLKQKKQNFMCKNYEKFKDDISFHLLNLSRDERIQQHFGFNSESHACFRLNQQWKTIGCLYPLKGQSYEKVCEIITWNDTLGPY